MTTGTTGPNQFRLDQATALTAVYSGDTQRTNFINQLQNATPDQVRTFVQNNVIDLASARVLLTQILLALALIISGQQ